MLGRLFRGLLIASIVALALMAGGCQKEEQSVKGTGQDFTLQDIDGNTVRLSDFRGKVVLLEFWATWCPPCRMAIPDLIALAEKYKDRDFALVAASIAEPRDKVKAFAEEHGMNYVVLVDDRQVSDIYGVRNIPTTFILDKEGKVVHKHLGYAPDMIEKISGEIEELL